MGRKFIVATIADIHFNAISAEEMYKQLTDVFILYITNHKVDMIVIDGDYYDSIVSLNSKSSHLSIRFIDKMLAVCSMVGVKYVRMIDGTLSHDNNQSTNFLIFEHSRKNVDFKVIKTVQEETIEDLEILYLPEEYMKDPNKYYEKYFNGDKKYDFIFGHGMFKEVSFMAKNQESGVTMSKAPVFDSNKVLSSCIGLVLFGHIHIKTVIKNRIIYIGSFSRWVFGEEEPKGFLVTMYDVDDKTFNNEFIENKLAKRYDTCTLVGLKDTKPEILVKSLDDLIIDKLRIKIIITDNSAHYSYAINFIKEYYMNNKQVKIDIVNKSVVLEELAMEEKIDEIMKKYGFIFDDKIPKPEKVSRYIKIRYGRNISAEKIAQ